MERQTDATTRSTTTERRAEVLPPSTGSGPYRRHPTRAVQQVRRPTARPGPHRGPAGVRRGHDLPDEDADRGSRGAEAGQHEDDHGDEADADLHEQIHRQRPIGPVRLQQSAVEREEDEEGGGRQDRRDADAALLVQQHGHVVPAGEHDHGPQQDDQGPLPVHPPSPSSDQVAAAVLVPDGHATHHGHHHRGPRHRENEIQPRQLVEDPVAVGGEQAGQRDGEDDAGPVGHDARRGERARLQEAGPHRLDSGPRLVVEEQIRPEGGTDRVGRERHRRRHGFDDDLGGGRLRRVGTRHARSVAVSTWRAPGWLALGWTWDMANRTTLAPTAGKVALAAVRCAAENGAVARAPAPPALRRPKEPEAITPRDGRRRDRREARGRPAAGGELLAAALRRPSRCARHRRTGPGPRGCRRCSGPGDRAAC